MADNIIKQDDRMKQEEILQYLHPSLHSQHTSRPWVRALKELITLNYLLN